MDDPLAPFHWLESPANPLEDIFCVSFFRGLTPTEVLHRFGPSGEPGEEVTFDQLWDVGDEPPKESEGGHIGVIQADGWSVALELGGWHAILLGNCAALSHGCEVVAVNRHDYASEDRFGYAVDGELITGFPLHSPSERWGSDPDRLNQSMHKIGLPTERLQDDAEWETVWRRRVYEHKYARAFALAAEVTGVPFTRELLTFPLLVGRVEGSG